MLRTLLLATTSRSVGIGVRRTNACIRGRFFHRSGRHTFASSSSHLEESLGFTNLGTRTGPHGEGPTGKHVVATAQDSGEGTAKINGLYVEDNNIDWHVEHNKTKKRRKSWEDRFNELKAYKEENGDCLVPIRDPESNEYSSLGRWVHSQRYEYKKLKRGMKSIMSDERISALEELGFVWSLKGSGKYGKRKSWNEWLDELDQYKATHGNCQVPNSYGPLGLWVARQRTQYKAKMAGRSVPLTDEKIDQLDSMGFEWAADTSKDPSKRHMSWDDWFERLKKYKAYYGHCRPDGSTGHERLADWVSQQRFQYHQWRKGNVSSMNASRIASLLEVEFEWDIENFPDTYRRVLGGNWDPSQPLAWTNDFGKRSAETEEKLLPLVHLKPGDKGYFDVTEVKVPNVTIVRTSEQAQAVLERLMGADPTLIHACDVKVMGIDLNKEGPVGNGYVACMTVYSGPLFDYGLGDGPGTVLWIDNIDDSCGLVGEFKQWLEHERYLKTFHNYGFVRHLLWNEGIDCQGFGGDTMHMARLQDTSRASHGHRMGYSLGGLVYELMDRKKPALRDVFGEKVLQKAESGEESFIIEVPPVEVLQRDPRYREKWIAYSSLDAEGIWQIRNELMEKLKKMPWMGSQNMYDFYSMHLRPFAVVLTDMERRGIRLDQENFMLRVKEELQKDREKHVTTFQNWANSKIGPDAFGLNPDNTDHLQAFLFGEKGNIEVFKVAADEFPFVDLSELQLRLLCKNRGLAVSGDKSELLLRLGLGEATVQNILEQSADVSNSEFEIVYFTKRLQGENWNAWFEKLKQYKEEHGHCRVDERKHKSLGKWARHQRYNYWLRAQGKTCSMTDERIKGLGDLGFDWALPGARSMQMEQWNDRLRELKQWKDEYGHCAVPEIRDGRHVPLGVWVSKQRVEYRLWEAGKPSKMTPTKIAALNKAGVLFELTRGATQFLPIMKWNKRVDELKLYIAKNGTSHVPVFEKGSKKYSPLGAWVAYQKRQYRLRKEGKPSTLSDERILSLLEIGCDWVSENYLDIKNKVDTDHRNNQLEHSGHLNGFEGLLSQSDDAFNLMVPSLGLLPERFTASGRPAVDLDVLRKLSGSPFRDHYGSVYEYFGGGNEGHEACVALHSLCAIDAIDKSISNFWAHLSPLADCQSRVHCSLNLHTETGRVSSRRPNLNQPSHLIRQAFSASPGNKLIVADYKQLELRLLASMAGCKSMIKAFRKDDDFHSQTALDIFSYIKKHVDNGDCLSHWDFSEGEPSKPLFTDVFLDERQKAKEFNFAIMRGDTATENISRILGVSELKATHVMRAWSKSNSEVVDWQKDKREFARKYSIARTLMGRYRHLPKAARGKQLSHLDRASITTPIEGGAADVLMMAMLKLNSNDLLQKLGWVLLMQINNELVLEGPQETSEEALVEVMKCMENPWAFGLSETKVPLVVDGSCRYEYRYEAK